MGMDGLSMANTGILKESTSAELSSRTEQAIHTDKTNDSKQVQTLSTNRKVTEKNDEFKIAFEFTFCLCIHFNRLLSLKTQIPNGTTLKKDILRKENDKHV